MTSARPPLAPRPHEDGGATLVGLALAAFVMVAGVLAVDVAALAVARASAQTAADMAALAALTPGAGSGARRAGEVASANSAELVACDCSATQAVVTVRRRVPLVPTGSMIQLTTRARAVLAARGPPPDRSKSRQPQPASLALGCASPCHLGGRPHEPTARESALHARLWHRRPS
jgi:secretion/DNA translocation related TadE-like protein